MKEVKIIGFENYTINELGEVKGKHNIRIGHISPKGYRVIHLHKSPIRKVFFIHRLLAIHFIPNPENKPFINHKDGNKLNNSLLNLEWCTSSENNKHAWDIGVKTFKYYKKGWNEALQWAIEQIPDDSLFDKQSIINGFK